MIKRSVYVVTNTRDCPEDVLRCYDDLKKALFPTYRPGNVFYSHVRWEKHTWSTHTVWYGYHKSYVDSPEQLWFCVNKVVIK